MLRERILNMWKRMIASVVALTMMLGCTAASAENTRHERVYAVTGADGTLKSLTDVIRVENRDGLDMLTDRTGLDQIVNLGGGEVFTQADGILTWKADGKDMIYQGESDRPLPVTPVVTLKLNGEDIRAEALSEKTGTVDLSVSYTQTGSVPHLVATAMLLPESGISHLKMEHAELVSLSGRQAVIGWASAGADPALQLPEAFHVQFEADHVSLGWMMTIASAEPFEAVCRELENRSGEDLKTEIDEVTDLLTALSNEETLPEATGRTREISEKINTLNEGLQKLDAGAEALASGAAEVSDGSGKVNESTGLLAGGAETLLAGTVSMADGAETLSSGLDTLRDHNAVLNQGADALFQAVLDTVNEKLAASGLKEAGVELPVLTADNYEEALDTVLHQFDPETLRAEARTQVEAVVRPKVEAGEAKIREAVTEAVQAQVLTQVLSAAGVNMDAQTYLQAVNAGKVPEDTAKLVQSTLEAQMASDEVQEAVGEAVSQQIDQLVAENTEKALSEDDRVVSKLQEAQAAYESLKGLREQLDQVNQFVTGLREYTDGVSQAADGAGELSDGAVSLRDGMQTVSDGLTQLSAGTEALSSGAAELAQGAAALHDEGTRTLRSSILEAEKTLAEKLMSVLKQDLAPVIQVLENTSADAANAGYDLRSEDIQTRTVYIIRTDLQ